MSEMLNKTQFYHATQARLQEGDPLLPKTQVGEGMEQPEGEEWRSGRVWGAKNPGNAGAWYGHDYPGVRVYEVQAEDPKPHTPNDWDFDIASDHAKDQIHAAQGRVVRKVPLEEWNDYARSPKPNEQILNNLRKHYD